jgi:hypothetical protein
MVSTEHGTSGSDVRGIRVVSQFEFLASQIPPTSPAPPNPANTIKICHTSELSPTEEFGDSSNATPLLGAFSFAVNAETLLLSTN